MTFSKLPKLRCLLACATSSFVFLTNCSNRPDDDLPFDADGNYVAEWDTDGTYKFEEPEPPSFYEAAASSSQSTASRRSSSSQSRGSSSRRVTPSSTTHTVQRGDTLWRISRKYNTSVAKIQRANGISGNLIKPGQRLKIPR